LDRIINFFPEERHAQLLMDISLNVQAFISQRLIPTIDGKRVAAIEILLGTPIIKDLIMKGDIDSIKEIMDKSEEMQTFDNHIYQLYKEGKISLEEALKNAESASNLQVKINLEESPVALASGNSDTENNDEEGESSSELNDILAGLELEPVSDEEDENGATTNAGSDDQSGLSPQELMEQKITAMNNS